MSHSYHVSADHIAGALLLMSVLVPLRTPSGRFHRAQAIDLYSPRGAEVEATVLIPIADLVDSPFALSASAGRKVYDAIQAELSAGRSVVLDFSGVENATTVFLNNAVGQLYGHYPEAEIEKRLQVRNAAGSLGSLLKLAVRNAKAYFADRDAAEARDRELVSED